MSKASWDQIRRQVRTFRALVQSQPPTTTLATIKDFCFDDETDRLYFLANNSSKPGSTNKSLMLYEIDLSGFDREIGPAPLKPTDLASTAASGPDYAIRGIYPPKLSGKNPLISGVSITSAPTSSAPSSPSFSSTTEAPTSTSSLIVDPTLLATIAVLPLASWHPLFSDEWMYGSDRFDVAVSREEQLAKERRRVATPGITFYQFDARTGRVLFAYGGSIYVGTVGKFGDYIPYQIRPPAFPFLPSAPFSSSPPKGLFPSHRSHSRPDSTTPSSPSPFTGLSSSPPASDLQSPLSFAMIPPRVDPKLGGRNGDLVAFIRNRDIWVSTLSGRETQLTFCSHNLDDDTLSCGVAEFVMQEEFHRFTGYHWDPTRDLVSPHSSLSVDRILYLEVSESMVDVVLIPRPGAAPSSTAECEEYRYPRAGTANATSDLQIVEFHLLEDRGAGGPDMMRGRGSAEYGPVHKRLWNGDSLRDRFPWMEYVVRFGWFPDGRSVWVQVLNRRQDRTAVVKIPAERFMSAREYEGERATKEEGMKWEGYGEASDEDDEEGGEGESSNPDTLEDVWGDRSPRGETMDRDGDIEMREEEMEFGRRKSRGEAGERGVRRAKRRMTVRPEERIGGWGKGKEEMPRKREGRRVEEIEVLWDEITEAWVNVTDLYHFFPTEDLPIDSSFNSNNPPPTFTRFLWASERTGHRHLYLVTKRSDEPAPHVRPITWGDWSVVDRPIHVDDVRKLVYFIGKRDTPLECHLYVAAYGGDDGDVEVEGECPARRLTALGYNHHVVMDGRCERFVDWFSSTECPPIGVVWWLEFEGKEEEEGDGEAMGAGAKDTRQRKRALKDEGYVDANENLDNATHKATKDRLPRVTRHRGIVIRDPAKAIAAARNGGAVDNGVGIGAAAAPASPTTGPAHPPSALTGTKPGTRLGTLWSGSALAAALGKQGGEAAGETAGINAKDSTGTVGGVEEGAGGVGNRNGSTNANGSGVDSVGVGIGLVATGGTKVPTEEFFNFVNSDGVKIYGCLYKPYNYVPGKSYPTLLSIYGGPKSQMVTNDYKFPRFLRFFLALRLGFAVVLIDSRGSSDRGTYFESYLRHRMGTVELVDQIEGLRYIAAAHIGAIPAAPEAELVSVIDLDRVAITGWSYGGYLSLMAIAQYPEIFKIAIAGAPVTQWELYDTAYTERYMGLPEENREGYQKGSVINWADKFPDGENRLLVVHGLIDENVHYKNTETLIDALSKHNKPHHLQVYPSERHGLRHATVNEHFETLMFFWLVNYL